MAGSRKGCLRQHKTIALIQNIDNTIGLRDGNDSNVERSGYIKRRTQGRKISPVDSPNGGYRRESDNNASSSTPSISIVCSEEKGTSRSLGKQENGLNKIGSEIATNKVIVPHIINNWHKMLQSSVCGNVHSVSRSKVGLIPNQNFCHGEGSVTNTSLEQREHWTGSSTENFIKALYP
uniref:Uncharacterized protein n=1 Tax=Physcomitrium patens TaxID=3218 RepID=A0A2K1KGN6_PHYPA|nr:hypothetical protein PHYPA_009325 [Physcomitrium patens]